MPIVLFARQGAAVLAASHRLRSAVQCAVISAVGWSGLAAHAALPLGAAAPDFTLPAALAGKAFTFSLQQALAKGPVVVYFYPKSFTAGCTAEAHAFAEAAPQFAAAGASLIGVSHDDLSTQKEFSRLECRDQFPVAADADAKVLKSYDAALLVMPNMAGRVSYVVSPQGRCCMCMTA